MFPKLLYDAYLNIFILSIGILWLLYISFVSNESNKEVQNVESFSSTELKICGAVLLTTAVPMTVVLLDSMTLKQSDKLQKCLLGRSLFAGATLIMGCQIVVKIDCFSIFESFVSTFYFSLHLLKMTFTASTMFCFVLGTCRY